MNFAKWAIAGAVGGVVGALIWAGISYAANAEIGWIAVGIGFVVGLCVRLATSDGEEGATPGVTAAGIAIASVLLGKYLAITFAVSSVSADMAAPQFTANDMIVDFADEIVNERQAKGQAVTLPGGISLDEADEQADYPPDIWQQASAKWQAIPPAQQQQKIKDKEENVKALMAALKGGLTRAGFMNSFSPYDLLWFVLAAGAAFRVGSGSAGSDD